MCYDCSQRLMAHFGSADLVEQCLSSETKRKTNALSEFFAVGPKQTSLFGPILAFGWICS